MLCCCCTRVFQPRNQTWSLNVDPLSETQGNVKNSIVICVFRKACEDGILFTVKYHCIPHVVLKVVLRFYLHIQRIKKRQVNLHGSDTPVSFLNLHMTEKFREIVHETFYLLVSLLVAEKCLHNQ